jgi:hypothetical protein
MPSLGDATHLDGIDKAVDEALAPAFGCGGSIDSISLRGLGPFPKPTGAQVWAIRRDRAMLINEPKKPRHPRNSWPPSITRWLFFS